MEKKSPSVIPDPEGDLQMLRDGLRPEPDRIIKKLSTHIHEVWTENQKNFKPIREDMAKLFNRIKGEYDPEKLAAIRAFRGSEAYIRSGENKCRAAESWLKDIYRGEKDLPWILEPTAEPELPDDTKELVEQKTQMQVVQIEQQLQELDGMVDPAKVAELLNEYYEEQLDLAMEEMRAEAQERCDRVSTIIRDQNQEGNWNDAFNRFLFYLTRMKVGIIKGPVLTKVKKNVWQPLPEGGYVLETIEKIVNDVYAVSPFNFYPTYGMKNVDDGNIIEIHELTKQGLADLIGVEGYSEDEIRYVIEDYEAGRLKGKWFTIDDETLVERATVDNSNNYRTTPPTQSALDRKEDKILAQEFWGSVTGAMLKDWGYKGELDPQMSYQANCWKIGKYVIKAVVNPDNFGRKPYHLTSWAKNPTWIIGEGLLEFAAPIEDCMNAVARALINNVAIASGPMAEIDKDRVDTKLPIFPWRQIESTSMQMKNDGPAVKYYQPDMHANELIQAWQFFGKILDEMTVPAYAQGMSQSGVTAGTATVFTQLLAAATRSVKAVVANIDDDVIAPYIQMSYDFIMETTDDPNLQGDTRVVAKGVAGLQAKEQAAQRKVEFLQVAMTPVLSQILGAKNIGALAAQIAKANDLDLPDIKRLEGGKDLQMAVDTLLQASQGVDQNQATSQQGNGGSPKKAQGSNPDGSKAGTNNG